jgi:hypothetical protein
VSLIPERLLKLMTDEERERVDAAVAGLRGHHIQCPRCSATLSVRLKTVVKSVVIDDDPALFQKQSTATSEESERQSLLDEADRTGLLAAFVEALEQSASSEATAKDKRGVLLTWFKNAKLRAVPRVSVEMFREEYPRGYLEFWTAHGVIGVVVEKVLRQFIPQRLVITAPSSKAMGGVAHRLAPPEQEARVWVRGRHGYVPVDTPIFSSAMRQRNVGEFAKLVQ